ncbi:MAG: hypothetical protein FWB90_09575 [Fibromonadales bacterium]|nr:hypothetical protein [Fibromonadales bacterium]
MNETEMLAEFQRLKNICIDRHKNGRDAHGAWNKCLGDITSCLFSHCIIESVKKKYDISRSNSFIEGFSYEFDLLILKKGAMPYEFTSIYKPKDVVCCMEFKSYAPFKNNAQLEEYGNKFKRMLKSLRRVNNSIKIIYLTMIISERRFDNVKRFFSPDIECFRIGDDTWSDLIKTIVF